MKCDDCENDVNQRFALSVEVDGMEADGSPWTEFRERMLCAKCYRGRIDSVPMPGVFTKYAMKQYDIDEEKFISEGRSWAKENIEQMVEPDPNNPQQKKLKPEFARLKRG